MQPKPVGAYVYVHFRPDTGEPFYVGKGRNGRYALPRRRGSHHQRLIEKFGGIENIPIVIVRENLSDEEAYQIEEALIRAIGIERDGGPLINLGYGGEGGPVGIKHSEEWRRVRSERAKEVWRRPEAREKYLRPDRKRSGNNKPRTEEFKKAVSEKLKGNTHTLGFKHSKETVEATRKRNRRLKWINNGKTNTRIDLDKPLPEGWEYGRILTPALIEGLAKARESNNGDALRGRKLSQEQKDRMRLAMDKRRAAGLPIGHPRIHPLVEKNCAWCGKHIVTREYKKCCSVSCSNRYRATPKAG